MLMDQDFARDRHRVLDIYTALENAAQRSDLDIVVLNSAGPIIRDRVVRHGQLLYARSERIRILFEAFAIKDALDFSYYSEIYDEALFHQLAEEHILD